MRVAANTLIIAIALLCTARAYIVKIKDGTLLGTKVTTNGPDDSPAYAFLGIPYAAPPVGDKRFAPPQKPEAWEGTRNATQYGPMCPHNDMMMYWMGQQETHFPKLPDIGMDEDCLSLNVFAPEPSAEARPVMVFIHGGALVLGTGAFNDGRVYATRHGVLLVTINYRLGPLGFLTTADDVVPGNMGFLDQVAALKWVQENIADFGGDPRQVTLFGESAGSWSVNFHVISPASRGLMSRVIYQSGAWGLNVNVANAKTVKNTTVDLAKYLNCSTTSSADMITCLRQVSVEKLAYALPVQYFQANPVVDGRSIPRDPEALMAAGEFDKELDVMAGVCSAEGYSLLGVYFPDFPYDGGFTSEHFHAYARYLLTSALPFKNFTENTLDFLVKDIARVYNTNAKGDELMLNFVYFLGDMTLAYPTIATALAHRDYGMGRLYFYEFNYRISTSTWPYFITAEHGDDTLFTFGASANVDSPFNVNDTYNQFDKQMDTIMPHYWTNFAKTGNPNGGGLVEWGEFSHYTYPYMKLQLPPRMSRNWNQERVMFWRNNFDMASAASPIISRVTMAAVTLLSVATSVLLL